MGRVAVMVATTLLVMTVSMIQRVEAQGPSCLTVSGAVAPFSDAMAVVQQLRVGTLYKQHKVEYLLPMPSSNVAAWEKKTQKNIFLFKKKSSGTTTSPLVIAHVYDEHA